jgi:hypothetical protein
MESEFAEVLFDLLFKHHIALRALKLLYFALATAEFGILITLSVGEPVFKAVLTD